MIREQISILLCPYMQFVSLSSNHALAGILQALHEHACLFYEKCNVDSVGKMPSNITVYGCVPFSKSGFGLQNRDFRDSVYKMKHEIRNTILPADSRLVPSPPASSLVFRGY